MKKLLLIMLLWLPLEAQEMGDTDYWETVDCVKPSIEDCFIERKDLSSDTVTYYWVRWQRKPDMWTEVVKIDSSRQSSEFIAIDGWLTYPMIYDTTTTYIPKTIVALDSVQIIKLMEILGGE